MIAAEEHDQPESGVIGSAETPGRAMRVAHALRVKDGDEFAKPGTLIEVKFVKGQSLSLTASRLLALMILTAGGDAWRDVAHRMRKADIRRGHKGNERISEMLEELHRTLFAVDDKSWRGRKATRRFSLISSSREEAEEEGAGESGWIEWEFTPDARKLIQDSETYAVLNRQAVLGFRSAYALKLYEMGALRIYRRQSTWRGDMSAFRAALGIPPEVYSDFAQLRRKVLDRAKIEIDQLAHFKLEWREIRSGRTVTELELRFEPKDAPAQLETLDEVGRHSSGRQARAAGTVQTAVASKPPPSEPARAKITSAPAAVGFPSGSLRYGDAEASFARLAREHAGGWDIDLVADAYRDHMGSRLSGLAGSKLTSSWTGFCQSFFARRGRP